MESAAAEAGASLDKAVQKTLRDTEEACRQEGLVFLPFAVETLGGLHAGAVTQVKQIAAALARSKGLRQSINPFMSRNFLNTIIKKSQKRII